AFNNNKLKLAIDFKLHDLNSFVNYLKTTHSTYWKDEKKTPSELQCLKIAVSVKACFTWGTKSGYLPVNYFPFKDFNGPKIQKHSLSDLKLINDKEMEKIKNGLKDEQ